LKNSSFFNANFYLPSFEGNCCGNPLAYSEVREGETVLDLGMGAGLDFLIASRKVGPLNTSLNFIKPILNCFLVYVS